MICFHRTILSKIFIVFASILLYIDTKFRELLKVPWSARPRSRRYYRLKLPGWICVTCERPFQRRWNAERHVYTQHSHESAEIVTFVDYFGRNSGVSRASSRMRAPPPNLGNIDLFQAQTRKSATHLQDILHFFEPHERSKQGETLGQSMTREFGLEFARQLARNF